MNLLKHIRERVCMLRAWCCCRGYNSRIAIFDKLRVNGLLEYWMSKEYHDMAAQELAKVDWSKQPENVKRIYKTPIWMLKVKRLVMKWGSAVKQAALRQAIRLKVRG